MAESIEPDADAIYSISEGMRNHHSPGEILFAADQIIAAAERIRIIARLRQTVEVVERDDD